MRYVVIAAVAALFLVIIGIAVGVALYDDRPEGECGPAAACGTK